MMRPNWDERISRARKLGEVYPFAAEVLAFYAAVAAFQRDLYDYARAAHGGTCSGQFQSADRLRASGFRERLDLPLLLPRFPEFLSLIQQVAPAPLAGPAAQIVGEAQEHWEKLLRNFWGGPPLSCPGLARQGGDSEPGETETFLARAFLQPYAEFVAEQSTPVATEGNTAVCPVCGAEPIVAVLRGEKLGARRSFICSFCSYEWDFPRGVCPGCGEDRAGALSVYTAAQFEHVRVDACDTCKTYIKTVDLTRNGLAIPVVDEIATLPLTLWAHEQGYGRLQANLMAV